MTETPVPNPAQPTQAPPLVPVGGPPPAPAPPFGTSYPPAWQGPPGPPGPIGPQGPAPPSPVYNVKTYGAVGDGVHDDTSALQAALTAACAAGGGTVLVPTGRYVLRSTLDWTHCTNVQMLGLGQPDSYIGGAVLLWNGAVGGTVHKIYDARGNLIEGITMLPLSGTAPLPGIYVDLNQSASPTINCTHNALRRCYLSHFSIAAVRITGTANCELNTFEDVTIDTGPSGLLFQNSQSKWNMIQGGNITGCTSAGIDCQQGSFTSIGSNFGANAIDVYVGQADDTITIIQPQSENSGRFLSTPGLTGTSWAITVEGGRLDCASSLNADGNYLVVHNRGPLNLIGVDFASGANRPAWRILAGTTAPGTNVNAVGCVFPNNTPWTNGGNAATIHQTGCNYADNTGAGLALADRWDGTFSASTLVTPVLYDTSNIVEQRNGTNAQSLLIYSTYTNASNYSRLTFNTQPSWAYILTENAGTGPAANINIRPAVGGSLYLGSGGVERWLLVTSVGHLYAAADNTYDIGASAGNRPRTVYAASNIIAGTSVIGQAIVANGGILQNGATGNACILGTGVPGAGLGTNGDYFFRSDTPATSLQRIYIKSGGSWVGIV